MGKSVIIASNTPLFISTELTRLREELGIPAGNISDQYLITVPEEKMSIGIEQIQALKEWSLTKPYESRSKMAVIEAAELMTTEAQNAALKLLEEPSESNHYVLVTGNYSLLLPTVLSRCELIYDNRNRTEKFKLAEFLEADELDRFSILARFDRYKSSAEKLQHINDFLLALILYCREQLLIETGRGGSRADLNQWIANISFINTCKQMLDAKVPAKSALDNLLINVNIPRKMV